MQKNEALDQAIDNGLSGVNTRQIRQFAETEANIYGALTPHDGAYYSRYYLALQQERFKFLQGSGEFASDVNSPVNIRHRAERLSQMAWANRSPGDKREIRLYSERKEREAIGQRNRRGVQNFD